MGDIPVGAYDPNRLANLGLGHGVIGVAGYFFNQLTGDDGAGARLGSFESRVAGIGPQIGYLVPVGGMKGFLELKGYKEFAAQNRAPGWNLWLTFGVSLPPAAAQIGECVPVIGGTPCGRNID